MSDAILLQNDGHVGFGDIVFKRAIAKHDLRIGIRCKLAVPVNDALSNAFNLGLCDLLREAGGADGRGVFDRGRRDPGSMPECCCCRV